MNLKKFSSQNNFSTVHDIIITSFCKIGGSFVQSEKDQTTVLCDMLFFKRYELKNARMKIRGLYQGSENLPHWT